MLVDRSFEEGRDGVGHICRRELGLCIELPRVGSHHDLIKAELARHLKDLLLEASLDIRIHE